MPVDPFSIDLPSNPLTRAAVCAARPFLSRLLAIEELRKVYRTLPEGPDERFADRVLDALDVTVHAAPAEMASIPSEGPLIVAATHPRGALDGLALAALLHRVRADVRLIANYLLARIPEMRGSCFFVDPFDHRQPRSLAGLRAAHLWLRRGGAIVVFPAGEVAHRRAERGAVADGRWSTTIGRLALATGARIVPASIDGTNSRAFYAAGRIHPRLRTLLLPRELLHARGERVRVSFAPPFAATGDAAATTDRARTAALSLGPGRLKAAPTYDAVAAAAFEPRATTIVGAAFRWPTDPNETVGAAFRRPIGEIADEVAALPPDACLVDAGRFQVFCATARQVPTTLQEIGRLRAVTYRAAGEGTGAEIDLDRFDPHYLHLFAWDRDRQRVIGAYRLAPTDEIIEQHGVDGLYTRTLFDYRRELLDRIAPALELGRSFVRVEYQRNHQALLLLWRGIGAFVVRHPRYRMLFGPVSISGAYSDASHALLVSFLEQNNLDASLARLVAPRHPRPSTTVAVRPADAGELDRLLSRLEPDGKGMPVLLRQYLKLNARALGFSLDPEFGHVVDALMVVALPTVDRKILRRYLGDRGTTDYLAHQARSQAASAA